MIIKPDKMSILSSTNRLRDVRADPTVAESSEEPDVASLSPLSTPGVLDGPEVPAVAVSAVAHHSHRVGEGHVARDEEPVAVSRHLGLAVAQSSVEPDVASLSPLSSPGVLDLPEVPTVAVSAVAHHSHRTLNYFPVFVR